MEENMTGYRPSTKIVSTILVALAMTVSLPVKISQAEELKLTLATGISPKVPTGWIIENYLPEKLKQYSEGRIVPNVHGNKSLCSEHKCVEQALLGQIDIGTTSSGNIGSFGTTFDILNLPYIFKDTAGAQKVTNGWLAKELQKRGIAEMKVHVLAIYPSFGFRNLDNNIREVRVPSDLKGIKIRVTKTATEFNLIKAWGGVPVPYDWGQLYEGLQTKVVNGMYIPDAYVAARKFYEVAPYITRVGGAWNPHIIFMAQKRYEELPEWARTVIDRVAAELQEEAWAIDEEWKAKAMTQLDGNTQIYTPTPEEFKLWYKGAPDAWEAVKGSYDPVLATRALKEQGLDSLLADLQAKGLL
tara:strand:- start:22518 stop:23588 length:1071 start_codon:yes stop_codon:yes gene_type:complete